MATQGVPKPKAGAKKLKSFKQLRSEHNKYLEQQKVVRGTACWKTTGKLLINSPQYEAFLKAGKIAQANGKESSD